MVALKNPLGILCHFLILKTTIIAWMSCCTFFLRLCVQCGKSFYPGDSSQPIVRQLEMWARGACWQWREVYTTRKCGEDKENEVFAILQVLLLQEDKKTKEAAAHTEGCGTSLFPPFQRLSTYCPREPLSMSHYTKVQHTSMCYHSHHPILLKTRKAISMAIPLQ